MLNFLLTHKIITSILVVLIAVAVWIGFSSSSSSGGSLLTTESADNSIQDRDLVSTLLALRSVKLDASLFTDTAFSSLKDFSVEIVSEPVGRPNPFAPLSNATADTSKDAQFFSSNPTLPAGTKPSTKK
jgi:hypothetical protein